MNHNLPDNERCQSVAMQSWDRETRRKGTKPCQYRAVAIGVLSRMRVCRKHAYAEMHEKDRIKKLEALLYHVIDYRVGVADDLIVRASRLLGPYISLSNIQKAEDKLNGTGVETGQIA